MLIRQALEAGQVNLAIRHINELDAEVRPLLSLRTSCATAAD